jgi:hypothetical protein
MLNRLLAAVGAALIIFAAPAHAAELNFTAALNGRQEPTITGSAATGTATFNVNTEARTVDVMLSITGISLDGLYDHVIHAGVGPVHLHLYAADGEISLLVPFAYGPTYAETADGFALMVRGLSYADGATLLGSELSFEAFVAALGTDFVYLNVHTDAFNDGEISGRLVRAG